VLEASCRFCRKVRIFSGSRPVSDRGFMSGIPTSSGFRWLIVNRGSGHVSGARALAGGVGGSRGTEKVTWVGRSDQDSTSCEGSFLICEAALIATMCFVV
jgi:hypothetical protein